MGRIPTMVSAGGALPAQLHVANINAVPGEEANDILDINNFDWNSSDSEDDVEDLDMDLGPWPREFGFSGEDWESEESHANNFCATVESLILAEDLILPVRGLYVC